MWGIPRGTNFWGAQLRAYTLREHPLLPGIHYGTLTMSHTISHSQCHTHYVTLNLYVLFLISVFYYIITFKVIVFVKFVIFVPKTDYFWSKWAKMDFSKWIPFTLVHHNSHNRVSYTLIKLLLLNTFYI